MLTKEVREWMNKVKTGQYSYEDAMEEFVRFSRFMTIEEIKTIKKLLENSPMP